MPVKLRHSYPGICGNGLVEMFSATWGDHEYRVVKVSSHRTHYIVDRISTYGYQSRMTVKDPLRRKLIRYINRELGRS